MQVIQTEPDGPATGTWYAVTTSAQGISSATLSLVQRGNSVSGTVAIIGGASGAVTGTVDGGTLTFTVNEISPCSGTFGGTAVSNDGFLSLNGSFSGADCGGPLSAQVVGINLTSRAGGGMDIEGTWNTTLTVAGHQAAARITLVQAGASLTGTAAIVDAGSGAMMGYVGGNTVRLTILSVYPCSGHFIAGGTISADGRTITGSGSGRDCGGAYSGTFFATKQ
jgi:hypothetical protein